MSTPPKQSFLKRLKRSNLLTEEQLLSARLWSQHVDEPQQIADRLVEHGLLTRWQSGQLLAGKHAFFLGKYKLLKVCGRGGMGVVFKAEQTDIDRVVAIKVLHKSLLKKQRAVARFMREIRSAATLSHPNIAVAYDADVLGDCYFLVMEYITGKSLKKWIKVHQTLPIVWSCETIRQAALGLEHIHERGLVHRDLKPSNLLVIAEKTSDTQVVKILDVGLARFASEADNDGDLTRAGQIVGTIDYMAPEQAKNAKEADVRADIFSLGCTLYHLLAGHPPLCGSTVLETYVARATQDALPVSTFRPEVPPALDRVIAKMLKRERDERFQTPRELADALASIQLGLPVEPAAGTRQHKAAHSGTNDSSFGSGSSFGGGSSFGAEGLGSLNEFLDELISDEPPEPAPPKAGARAARSVRRSAPVRTRLTSAPRRWLRALWDQFAAVEPEPLLPPQVRPPRNGKPRRKSFPPDRRTADTLHISRGE